MNAAMILSGFIRTVTTRPHRCGPLHHRARPATLHRVHPDRIDPDRQLRRHRHVPARHPGLARFGTYLILGSPLTILSVVLYLSSFDEATTAAGRGMAGLLSRILVVEIHAWFVAMGWLAFRQVR
jgi:hypothetical protein